jgi:hypothetical protein
MKLHPLNHVRGHRAGLVGWDAMVRQILLELLLNGGHGS